MTDLFPGFASQSILAEGAYIFVRTGGSGPPLLLLHGFPQTHMMWHRIAAQLAERFTLVIADLRGYGRSSSPLNSEDNYTYSKRAMGRDFFNVMSALGHHRFMVCGHDRGGRVAYRMALDEPTRVSRMALLNIVTTYDMWKAFDAGLAMNGYHWTFLAQDHPMPETMIGANPQYYLDWTLASWTASRDLSAFDETALADYRQGFTQAERLYAVCNDYRAGWTYDRTADEKDRDEGRMIQCPLQVLWGSHGIPGKGDAGPLELWQPWCDQVSGGQVDCGHFLAEENPEGTLEGLVPFLEAE